MLIIHSFFVKVSVAPIFGVWVVSPSSTKATLAPLRAIPLAVLTLDLMLAYLFFHSERRQVSPPTPFRRAWNLPASRLHGFVGLSRLPSRSSVSQTWTFLLCNRFCAYGGIRYHLSKSLLHPAFPRWRHRRCVLSCLHRLWRTIYR